MTEKKLPTSGIAALEAGLWACQETARKSLAEIEKIDPNASDYERFTDAAYRRAIAFLEAGAKVGMALAKMKGEHTSNIRIHRTQSTEQEVRVEFPAPARREKDPASKPLDPATEDRLNQIYDDWLTARATKQGDVEDNSGFDEEKDEEEGVPPADFGGSNTPSP